MPQRGLPISCGYGASISVFPLPPPCGCFVVTLMDSTARLPRIVNGAEADSARPCKCLMPFDVRRGAGESRPLLSPPMQAQTVGRRCEC